MGIVSEVKTIRQCTTNNITWTYLATLSNFYVNGRWLHTNFRVLKQRFAVLNYKIKKWMYNSKLVIAYRYKHHYQGSSI